MSSTFARVAAYIGLPDNAYNHIFEYNYDTPKAGTATGASLILPDAILVSLCVQGTFIVSLNGFSYALKKGDLYIVLPNTYYRIIRMSPDFKSMVFMAYTGDSKEQTNTLAYFPKMVANPVIPINQDEQSLILHLFEYIKDSFSGKSNIYHANISEHLMLIMAYEVGNMFYKRYGVKQTATLKEAFFQKFIGLVENNFRQHRDVEFYAEQLDMTPKKLAEKIKSVSGRSPLEWISGAVIKNAQTMLKTSDLSIAEIARHLNFANPSFFCQYFKRYAGFTPQRWRQAVKKFK